MSSGGIATGAARCRWLGVGGWEHGDVDERYWDGKAYGGKRVEDYHQQNKGEDFRVQLRWCWEDKKMVMCCLWEGCNSVQCSRCGRWVHKWLLSCDRFTKYSCGWICVQGLSQSRWWRGHQHKGKRVSEKWCASRQSWQVCVVWRICWIEVEEQIEHRWRECALCMGEAQRAVMDLDKKQYVIEVKRKGVCDMCEGCNGVWKWDLGHECRAERIIWADRDENAVLDVWCVSERMGIQLVI